MKLVQMLLKLKNTWMVLKLMAMRLIVISFWYQKENQVLDVFLLEDDLILQDAVAHLHFVVIDVVHPHAFSVDPHHEYDFHHQEDVYQDHVHLPDVDHLLEEEVVDPHQEEKCHDHLLLVEDIHLDLQALKRDELRTVVLVVPLEVQQKKKLSQDPPQRVLAILLLQRPNKGRYKL